MPLNWGQGGPQRKLNKSILHPSMQQHIHRCIHTTHNTQYAHTCIHTHNTKNKTVHNCSLKPHCTQHTQRHSLPVTGTEDQLCPSCKTVWQRSQQRPCEWGECVASSLSPHSATSDPPVHIHFLIRSCLHWKWSGCKQPTTAKCCDIYHCTDACHCLWCRQP